VIFLKKDLKVLRQSKLFTGIKGEEICLVLKCLSPAEKAFTKGEYILRSGNRIKSMGLVLSGCVHIIKEDYWGNRTMCIPYTAGAESGVRAGGEKSGAYG
jgi:signal-transduction protein with cAMP-binding, CBS, and nucleotidyltransferase domain